MFVIWTRYQTLKGTIVRHAYGPYATRSKADTAKRKMLEETRDRHSVTDLARTEIHVIKVINID